jgi:predicted Zn-dependent protease
MPGVVGPDEIRRAVAGALEVEGVDDVEVLFMHEWGGLTRFASSSIHQSTWTEDTALRIRVVKDGRIGVAGEPVNDQPASAVVPGPDLVQDERDRHRGENGNNG